jgi:putative transposase
MRFRLAPTGPQEEGLLDHCGHARYVWNLGLEQRLMWRPGRPSAPGYVAQSAQLTEARRAEPWLAAGSQTVQQQSLRDLDQAWRNFYSGTHRRPTWRKARLHEGFQIVGPQARRVEKLSRKWARVLVPKVGWVRFRLTRPLPDAASYRITRDRAGRWQIAFAVIPPPVPAPGNGKVIGVDRGVKVAAATSDGDLHQAPGLTSGERQRLRRLQKKAARQHVRGRPTSSRLTRTRTQIARLKAREADRRKNFVEQLTTQLARDYEVIRVEDLNIRAMTRSGRGTLEEPGRRVRQKAGLNRGILASGWGLLVRRLEDKAPGRVEKIAPAYTSQTCAACGHCAPGNRESQAVFECVACGHTAHADINAAINIAAGRAVTARGDLDTSRPTKREPQLSLLSV